MMGANYIRPMFKKISKIVFEKVASTTAGTADSTSFATGGKPLTIHCSTGDVYIFADATASTANGFHLYEGMTLDVQTDQYLSVIGNSTTAKVQGIIWEG